MATNKLNFTKAALLKAPSPPKGKLDYYKDLREGGLEMIATSGGAKTFYLYRKINGKAERIKLGKFPDISVENARKAAQKNKGLIASGINPNEEKRRVRDEYTFKALFDEYMQRYSKIHKKSWQYDINEVNKHLSHWFNRKISSITKDEVARLHAKIGKDSGIYQANRILERIRGIFNKAIEWGWQGVNPATGIKKFKEQSRDRFLNAEEMPQFLKSLDMEGNPTARDFFKVLLLTGVRKSNALTMRWEQICFNQKTWRIPETKNGEPLTIPLNDHVISILKQRREASQCEWVFEGKGKLGHLNDPKKAWKRILDRTDIKDLRMHDLRRTFGSWQAALGANSYVIGKSLGHKSQQSTAIYARLNLDPVRESTNKAVDAMLLKAQESEA